MKRVRAAFAAVLAVLALLAVIRRSGGDASPIPGKGPSMVLPDGTRFGIVRMSLGTRQIHERTFGPGWAQPWARTLPEWVHRVLRWSPLALHMEVASTGDTNLFLTGVARFPGGTPGVGARCDPNRLRVTDDDGGTMVIGPSSASVSSHESARIWRLRTGPSASRELRFDFLYDLPDGSPTNTPSWVLPNPFFESKPSGSESAVALPWKAMDGDLEFRLLEAFNGAGGEGYGDEAGLFLRFELYEQGARTSRWQPVGLEWVDRRAGFVDLRGGPVVGEPTNTTWRASTGLWRDASGCRLRLEFSRTAGFDDGERRFSPPIPLDGSLASGLAVGPWHRRYWVTVHSLTPPGGRVPAPYSAHIVPWKGLAGVHTLWIKIDPPPEGFRFSLMGAEDDRGREVAIRRDGWTGEMYAEKRMGDLHSFGLRTDEGAKAVRLELGLHASRFFEFVIDPRIVGPERSPP